MDRFVRDDFARATTFFALAFGIATAVGLLMGDLRLGIEWGLPLGVAFRSEERRVGKECRL